MSSTTGVSARMAASRFFDELQRELAAFNERTGRTIQPRGIPFGPKVQLSMSRLVSDTLKVNNPEVIVSKIRQGRYTPSNERIERIANRLKISPSKFTDYVIREIQQEAQHDPDIIRMFRALSASGKGKRKQIIREVIDRTA